MKKCNLEASAEPSSKIYCQNDILLHPLFFFFFLVFTLIRSMRRVSDLSFKLYTQWVDAPWLGSSGTVILLMFISLSLSLPHFSWWFLLCLTDSDHADFVFCVCVFVPLAGEKMSHCSSMQNVYGREG